MPPPNTPIDGLSLSPTSPTSKTPTPPHRVPIDLRQLEYVSSVDQNLLCPICHIAFVDPVTTKCDHVFCRDCLRQAWDSSKSCPIDRSPLRFPEDVVRTHKIILNQLDGLDVKCPNASEGCDKLLARSMVQNHVDRYCPYTLVECPEKTCGALVARKESNVGCLHWYSNCPDCNTTIMQANMRKHREVECPEKTAECPRCGQEMLRCKTDEHEEECPEAMAACKWAVYGCDHTSRRRILHLHNPECTFRTIGPVAESLKKEMESLRAELQTLQERDKIKDRRIKFLESDRPMPPTHTSMHLPPPDMSTISSEDTPDWQPYDTRDQYLLSLLESQESKVDQISQGMTELEAKQTMMLFNETLPIKEQLAELRSAQGVVSMHVRWLMNFRMQERRPQHAAAPSASSSASASSSSNENTHPVRRLSDSTREKSTKL